MMKQSKNGAGHFYIHLAAALLAFGTVFCLTACSGESKIETGESIEPIVTDSTEPVTLPTETTVITTTTEPAAPPDISVNMLAVGDNLVQTYVYKAAQARAAAGEESMNMSSRSYRKQMSL